METILRAFSEIALSLPRIDRLKDTFSNTSDLNQALALIYSDITDFHQRAYKIFRRKAWHFWFTFNWGLFEHRYKSILHRLSSHCDLLDKEAASIHYSEMKAFRLKRQQEDDVFEQQSHVQMAANVHRWLAVVDDDQEEQLHRFSDKRLSGSCDWILATDQVRSWIDDDEIDPVLWMTGIPGAGKSFLCSMIIDNLQCRKDLSIIYYFCGKRSGDDTTVSILRNLATQLLQMNTDLIPLVHQAFVQCLSHCSTPNVKRLLGQILPSVKSVRMVIDGIDECDHIVQLEVLKAIREMHKQGAGNCRTLICSRDTPRIQQTLMPKIHMKLGKQSHVGLPLYIEDKLEELQDYFGDIKPALLDAVKERLTAKAGGMFLWVRLVVAMLTQLTSEAEIEESLDYLPDGLEEAYASILANFHKLGSIERDRVMRILHWTCVAYRPVKIQEIADGIVLNAAQTRLDRTTRCRNPDRDIVRICAPILEKSDDGTVELVHFSAKEYLIDKRSGPFVNRMEAHLNIAVSCVVNLTTCLDLLPGYHAGLTEIDLESCVVQGYYGLHAYGHEYWAEHVLAFLTEADNSSDLVTEMASVLVKLSKAYKHHHQSNPMKCSSDKKTSVALTKLENQPVLYNFLACWQDFRSNLNEMLPDFDDVEAQQDWKLRSDETYFSSIELRLLEITERILAYKPDQLPSHIDANDFEIFTGRFYFTCRFGACNQSFSLLQARNAHEASHEPSFPCLQCDFAAKGFKSRKDLERHVQKYHMSIDDFSVPDVLDLETGNDHIGSNGNFRTPFGLPLQRNRCWNGRGRKVLKQGFEQALTKVGDELAALTLHKQQEMLNRSDKNEHTALSASDGSMDEILVSPSIARLWDRVEAQHYECLADFKDDLRVCLEGSSLPNMDESGIQAICNGEIESAMSKHPVFANFSPVKNDDNGKEFSRPEFTSSQLANSVSTERVPGGLDDSAPAPHTERNVYWSKPERSQLPELLEKYGRDFAQIAQILKTKTSEEVSHHFDDLVANDQPGLLVVAEQAETRLEQEQQLTNSQDNESKQHPDTDQANTEAHLSGDVSAASPPPVIPAPNAISALSESGPLDPAISGKALPLPHSIAIPRLQPSRVPQNVNDERPKAKRKPPRRYACNQCSEDRQSKVDFYDDFALRKHEARFHSATRKVWVCKDLSDDKAFLSKCKSCRKNREYTTKHYASKHLRKLHFSEEEPLDTVNKWMEEMSVPNPNARTTKSNAPTAEEPGSKRQKTEPPPPPPPRLMEPLPSIRSLNGPLPPFKLRDQASQRPDTTLLQSSAESRADADSAFAPMSANAPSDGFEADEDITFAPAYYGDFSQSSGPPLSFSNGYDPSTFAAPSSSDKPTLEYASGNVFDDSYEDQGIDNANWPASTYQGQGEDIDMDNNNTGNSFNDIDLFRPQEPYSRSRIDLEL